MLNDICSVLADLGIDSMSDQQSYLAAIDAEMARLRERLDKLAKFKELAIELGITPDVGVYQPQRMSGPMQTALSRSSPNPSTSLRSRPLSTAPFQA